MNTFWVTVISDPGVVWFTAQGTVGTVEHPPNVSVSIFSQNELIILVLL